MPINYTNRKGMTYTLYRGQTRTGKPRYYFGLPGQNHGEPVAEIPPGYSISESLNGVVSLVKDRSSVILPEELRAVEAVVQQHPEARRYRVIVKGNRIEVHEQVGADYLELMDRASFRVPWRPGLAEELRELEERHARFTPIMRFTLLDKAQRSFGAQRMSYRGGNEHWLDLWRTRSSVAELAQELIPTLGTEEFFELW